MRVNLDISMNVVRQVGIDFKQMDLFYGSIQEEFIDYDGDLLLDPSAFNRELISWLL